MKEFRPLLKSTEFTLGPKWYDNVETTHIDFYDSDEPFYEFNNFYNCDKLFMDLISWTTSEHAFDGNMFVGTPLMTYVSKLDTPRKAFEFARIPMVQRWIRPDWHSIKTQVMLNVLRHKFVQNPDLADILNRTGEKRIFEHTSNDKFWGDGGDRTGANKLGELLMKVRSELRISTPYLPNTLNHFPIPDKVDIPPDQTPTPSYPSSSNPDVNIGTVRQDKSTADLPTNQTHIASHLGSSDPMDMDTVILQKQLSNTQQDLRRTEELGVYPAFKNSDQIIGISTSGELSRYLETATLPAPENLVDISRQEKFRPDDVYSKFNLLMATDPDLYTENARAVTPVKEMKNDQTKILPVSETGNPESCTNLITVLGFMKYLNNISIRIWLEY